MQTDKQGEKLPTKMRPPGPMTRLWLSEKNSFPVRGLVMYRWPTGWGCNIELLRITREQVATLPLNEAAYEISLSAVYRYMTSEAYEGKTTPVRTARGKTLLVPDMAFDLAPFLVERVSRVLHDGGGAITFSAIAGTQKFLALATTGSARDAQAWNLPAVKKGAERVSERIAHEFTATARRQRAIAARRKALAKYWFKNKLGFYTRGLVFTGEGPQNTWAFNVPGLRDRLEPVQRNKADDQALSGLVHAVSLLAIDAFAAGVNIKRGGNTLVQPPKAQGAMRADLTDEVRQLAADRLAARLLGGMKKHGHGVVSLAVIERCLVVAFDPLDEKPLDDYPFPLAPTADPSELDRAALDKLNEYREKSRALAKSRDGQDAQPDLNPAQDAASQSWRDELGIEDWVPLEEPFEDDETIDRRALQKADHDQSAALRRMRGEGGGRVNDEARLSSVIQHHIDYTGLPKDED